MSADLNSKINTLERGGRRMSGPQNLPTYSVTQNEKTKEKGKGLAGPGGEKSDSGFSSANPVLCKGDCTATKIIAKGNPLRRHCTEPTQSKRARGSAARLSEGKSFLKEWIVNATKDRRR